MKLGIMCGSLEANLDVRGINSYVAKLIAGKDYDWVMGSGNTGSMHDIKEIAMENGRKVLTVGLEREESPATIKVSLPTERVTALYNLSDAVVFLSGGLGTFTEFLGFLDNKKETNDNKPLIIYNEDHSYDFILKTFEDGVKRGCIDKNYKLYFDEVHDVFGLAESLQKAENIFNKNAEERSKVR